MARERKHERGLQDAPDDPGRPGAAPGGATPVGLPAPRRLPLALPRQARAGRRRFCAWANADSSNDVWNRSSSATISSTRSSELRPSSSMLVAAPTLRPCDEAGQERFERGRLRARRGRRCLGRRSDPAPDLHAASACACPRCAAGLAGPRRGGRGSAGGRPAARWPSRTTSSSSTRRARARAPRGRARSPPSVRPTTADSRTPGSAFSTRSTSSGKTFSPSGVTIISFLRPRM